MAADGQVRLQLGFYDVEKCTKPKYWRCETPKPEKILSNVAEIFSCSHNFPGITLEKYIAKVSMKHFGIYSGTYGVK